MIKKIIDISQPAHLHLKKKQLVIEKKEHESCSFPIEDLGILILEHPAITLTQAVTVFCSKHNVAIIFCDEKRLPYSLLLPISDAHTIHSKILKEQIAATIPVKKRLWQQIIKQKISEQITTLSMIGKDSQALCHLAKSVKSGDKNNHEAQAAKIYWKLLFGKKFKRDIDASGINTLLNYGYAIVRSMVARAIVGTGLHPAIGLHHKNQYNGLCLVDDVMEPFRPWVDFRVFKLIENKVDLTISQNNKRSLISILSDSVLLKCDSRNKRMPLLVASHYLSASLKRALNNIQLPFVYPKRIIEDF